VGLRDQIIHGDSRLLLDRFAAVGAGLFQGDAHPAAPTAARTLALLDRAHPTRRRCEVELVVGLCAEEACPVVPGVRSLHWPLPNPAGQSIERFREVRDELSVRVRALIRDLTGAEA